MKTIGIIPARLNSTRLPRKARLDIHGLPMCIHVYRRALMSPALNSVVIATDSEEIMSVAQYHGANAQMTRDDHRTPTSRMAEVIEKSDAEVIVQINGDEPMLRPEHIDVSVETLVKSGADATVLARQFSKRNSPSDFKLVLNNHNDVMYVSRSDIPVQGDMLKAYHVMSFTRFMLQKFIKLYKTPMEKQEGHELLRLLEHGYQVRAAQVDSNAISVDVPEDLEYVRKEISTDPLFAKYR